MEEYELIKKICMDKEIENQRLKEELSLLKRNTISVMDGSTKLSSSCIYGTRGVRDNDTIFFSNVSSFIEKEDKNDLINTSNKNVIKV